MDRRGLERQGPDNDPVHSTFGRIIQPLTEIRLTVAFNNQGTGKDEFEHSGHLVVKRILARQAWLAKPGA